ncbi:MAG: trypsin-like peptidase domain-containing protein [Tepidamorphaceae bacterium]
MLTTAEASFACTAFCVATDAIATNAHCPLRERGPNGPVQLGDMRFSLFAGGGNRHPALFAGTCQRGPAAPLRSAGTARRRGDLPAQSGDWALAKLKTAVCRGRELELAGAPYDEIARAAKEKRLFMIGYQGDKMLIEKWLSPCGIRSPGDRKHFLASQRRTISRSGTLLPHTCDMYEGASGSPLIMERDGKYSVVAMNSGGAGFSEYRQTADGSRRRVVASRMTNLAVLASAFAPSLERFRNEKLLRNIGEFEEPANPLKDKGYYRSAIDGLYGPGTRRAIVTREKELGLTPLGMPTRELLLGLRAEKAKLGG